MAMLHIKIIGNAAYYYILASILLLHLPLTRGWGQKVNAFFSYLKVVMMHNQIN